MKLVNLQIALFFKEKLERPDLFANRINSRMNNVFDAMPQILNLPDEAPADIPVVQMQSTKEDTHFNISKVRCDLIVSPELLAQTALASSVSGYQEFVYNYFKCVFEEECNIVRIGVIATAFNEQENAANFIGDKYLFSSCSYKEASIRVNRSENADNLELNNIVEVSDGNLINEKLRINQNGIVIRRDINNVPNDDNVLTIKNVKAVWKRALIYFTDKKIGELK